MSTSTLELHAGNVHWGDHLDGVEPINFIELDGDVVFDAEQLIRELAGLPHDSAATAELVKYNWCCKPYLARGKSRLELVFDAIQWDPDGDPAVLKLGRMEFSRQNFLALMKWLSAQPAWDPEEGFRPLNLDADQRRKFQELLRLAERMAA